MITMDADLQDEPAEIPNFLQAIEGGMDLVSGWKKKRYAPLNKRLPSKLFNWTTYKIAGVRLHDFNCGFKAYRRELLDHIDLYGELHRYIPAPASWKGFNVGEIVVKHHPRKFGKSKYGRDIRRLGNHPEHINQWGISGFRDFVRAHAKIVDMYTVFPFIIVLAERPTREQ